MKAMPHPPNPANRVSLLIVDDEASIRHVLRSTLDASGFDVAEASTGEEALAMLCEQRYDAVLLDMNMPGMGGMKACSEIRRLTPAIPIVMLTVRDNPEDKVAALDAGADDYVTKPFHLRELTARVRAAIRRSQSGAPAGDDFIRIGGIELIPARREVTKSGQRIRLTPTEFDLLHFLMSNAGKPVEHSRLLSAVWGSGIRRRTGIPENLHSSAPQETGGRPVPSQLSPDRDLVRLSLRRSRFLIRLTFYP